jgi:hypothetical protein
LRAAASPPEVHQWTISTSFVCACAPVAAAAKAVASKMFFSFMVVLPETFGGMVPAKP